MKKTMFRSPFRVRRTIPVLVLVTALIGAESQGAEKEYPAWYKKQATWWETMVLSEEAIFDEVDTAKRETKEARASDPAVKRFKKVQIESDDGAEGSHTFKADVTGLKTLFLEMNSRDPIVLKDVCLVDVEGKKIPLIVKGKEAHVTRLLGHKRLRDVVEDESGTSFSLQISSMQIALDGKFAAIVGTTMRPKGAGRKFTLVLGTSHREEFSSIQEEMRKELLKLLKKDYSKDEAAKAEMDLEINQLKIFSKPWVRKRGDYSPLAKRYEEHAAPAAKGRVSELVESMSTLADLSEIRAQFITGEKCDELLVQMKYGARPLIMALEDLTKTFPDTFKNGPKYLVQAKAYEKTLPGVIRALEDGDLSVADKAREFMAFQRKALLENPLLDIEKLLVIRGKSIGLTSNWNGANRLGQELVFMDPKAPENATNVIYTGSAVSSFDLSWDTGKVLFSDSGKVMEVNSDGTGLRTISNPETTCYDPCRLPSGKIMFLSTACEQAVPCTGGAGVGNMHVMDDDGSNERRITFDQDHNWDPYMLNNGRVVYARWEYTDTPHYFTRLLMHMNPDGTDQKEYYGSSSYWPNAMYWAKPIPGDPTKVVTVVSGHHGVARSGELLILDPAKGRHEADGVVQRIPGWGQKVEPVILDRLVVNSWPRFITPYPLAEPGTHKGAGKYFLATVKMTPSSPWGLYIVDVFDNMVPIAMGNYSMATPFRTRPKPPVVPERIDLARKDATVMIVDIYEGGGLKGYPKGSVKALRVGTHHFRYPGGGGSPARSAYEGGWDPKIILGTVPVHEDGSAMFNVPANTPIFVQPLDEEGKSLQVMRSWFTAMPGETLSCIGCHESQNSAPPARPNIASRKAPSTIKEWYGPERGYSFNVEVQPVLDRRCVGCHNGEKRDDGKSIPDLRAQRLHEGFNGKYSPSYMAIQAYVRRAGFESDYHLPNPAEYQADTSALVQMLKKGHHNVKLTREEWERLYTWIDFNVPYASNWNESHFPPQPEQVERRAKYLKLYAGIDDTMETPVVLPPIAKFEPPAKATPPPKAAELAGWPIDEKAAAEQQKQSGLSDMELDLGDDIKIKMVPVPAGKFVMGSRDGFTDERAERVVAIEKPFHIAQFEITNEQFQRFMPDHDSRYIDGRGKDRSTRGRPINGPEFPAVRMTWRQADAFCKWLSDKTGYRCSLPTEEQWEYACRAGRSGPLKNAKKQSTSVPGGKSTPNAWRIYDMEENVAEWTSSGYDPSDAAVYQDTRQVEVSKTVRGPSWDDKLTLAPTTRRWRYPEWQPVYNVGFRVICEAPAPALATTN